MSAGIATPRGTGWMHRDARLGVSMILASAERWIVWGALALYLLGMAAPWLGSSSGARDGVLLFIAAFFAWMLLFSRPLATAWRMEELRVPGATRSLRMALAAALALGVVLPAGVLALGAGMPFLEALGWLFWASMTGLAMAWMPGRIVWGFCFLPMLVLFGLDMPMTADVIARLRAVPPWAWLWLLALVFAALAWICARTLLASARGDALPAWRQPLVLWWAQQQAQATGSRGGWITRTDMAQAYGNTPEWLTRINGASAFGAAHRDPVTVLRAWLGSPYAPLHLRDRLRQLGIVAGSLLLYPVLMVGVLGERASWQGFIAIGGGFATFMLVFLFAFMFPAALVQRRVRASAEYADLALLPGLGDARRYLPRAVAGPLLAFMAGMAVFAALVLLAVAGEAGVSYAHVALALVGIGVMVTASCLRALAGQTVGMGWSVAQVVLMLVLLVAGLAGLVPKLAKLLPPTAMDAAQAGWWLAIVAYAAFGWRAWRRYRALPHPFLQE